MNWPIAIDSLGRPVPVAGTNVDEAEELYVARLIPALEVSTKTVMGCALQLSE
jgi:hypothetical protein